MDAVAGHHTVGRPHVLDLGHHPLVGQVGRVALGDQPVEAGALEELEPRAGQRRVARDRGEMDRRRGRRQRRLQRGAALAERPRGEVLVAERQQVERDERGRRAVREQRDPARGRVQAQLQRPEVERRPSWLATTISPSTTQRRGRLARTAATTSGK